MAALNPQSLPAVGKVARAVVEPHSVHDAAVVADKGVQVRIPVIILHGNGKGVFVAKLLARVGEDAVAVVEPNQVGFAIQSTIGFKNVQIAVVIKIDQRHVESTRHAEDVATVGKSTVFRRSGRACSGRCSQTEYRYRHHRPHHRLRQPG